MLRALSIFLPAWRVDLAKRRSQNLGTRAQPEAAILVVRTSGRRPQVAACCGRGFRAGVRPGMTIADARALLRGPVCQVEESPGRDEAALESLARWALRFTPVVAVDPPDGLLLNVTGCGLAFRGEDRLLALLQRGLTRLNLTHRCAIAPTFGGAWALARYGENAICIPSPGHLALALEDISVRGLRLTDQTLEALAEIGIERIGQVKSLPRGTLPARFGNELLTRLDQALGYRPETIEPVRPVEPPWVEQSLSGPTTNLEAITLVVRGLLDQMVNDLRKRGAGARQIDAIFDRPDVGPVVLSITAGRPTRDAQHLWTLLRPHVERMHLGFGVERIELIVPRWSRIREAQHAAWELEAAGDRGGAFAELCDVVRNRLGSDCIHRPLLLDAHLPERSWRLEAGRGGSVDVGEGDAAFPLVNRPSYLLPRPEAIMVETDEDKPARLVWRGRPSAIVASIGPERLAEAWWDTPQGPRPTEGGLRDYFRVQAEDGVWMWIFRDLHAGRWFLHGMWV